MIDRAVQFEVYKPLVLPSSDFQIGKAPDLIKPNAGKGRLSSVRPLLPPKLVLMFTLKWKISNHFACSQMFFFLHFH